MPVIIQNYCMANSDSFLDSETTPPMPNISISELLFPAFNSLMPQFLEHVVPHLTKVKNS